MKPGNDTDALTPAGIGIAAGVLAVAMVLVFGDVIFFPQAGVLSMTGHDIFSIFLSDRAFAFNQVRQGNFPLWCPSTFAGCPCFGGFQSGLAYPLSFLYMVMPVAKAINWGFILHTFLGGMFMYLWLGRQSLHRYASLAGALMFAFCAPFYLRIYAGHVTPHCVITWIPLVFLAFDGLLATATVGWMVLAAFALTMELLGGYPQVFYYTLIAVGFYYFACLPHAARPLRSILMSGLAGLLTLGLSCVQWAAALAMTSECVRQAGVPFDFAASLSFPPENWLTAIRPGLLGDMTGLPYWGRWYLWEMCLYFGTLGLFFAIVGLWHSQRRRIVIIGAVVVITGILATGSYSPHFRFFYDHIPGFNLFRSNSKFIILTVLFLIALSAHGLDLLFREPKRTTIARIFTYAVAFCGLLALLAGLPILCSTQTFSRFMTIPLSSGQLFTDPALFTSPEMVARAARFAAGEFGLAFLFMSALVIILGMFLWRPAWRRSLAPVLVGVVGLELLLFAWQAHVTFPPESIRMPELEQFLKKELGECRIFNPDGSNIARTMDNVSDLWGYGADRIIRRYAEFMAFTQGNDPDQLTGYQLFSTLHPRFDLLRCKYVFTPTPTGSRQVSELKNPLPRFLLMSHWTVESHRDAVFATISHPEFDPARTVVLERPPAGLKQPPLSLTESGSVRLISETTDWQEVEINTPHPAILLETDLYSPNWHVRALPGSAQAHYELIPADYILRAIPLSAGVHHLRIEYRPTAFVVGKWISLASLALFMGMLSVWVTKRVRTKDTR